MIKQKLYSARLIAFLYFIFLFICFCFFNKCKQDSLYSSLTSYPADGVSGGILIFEKSFMSSDKLMIPKTNSIQIIEQEDIENTTKLYFKTTKNSGKVLFTTKNGLKLEIIIYSPISDADEDGFPDAVELSHEDEIRFRNWFVRIAEAQFIKPNSFWNPNERDCAGLIRYSFREAFKKHDENWYKQSGFSLDKNLPDITSYHYPDIPILGIRIFKQKKGDSLDLESFGTFANAETLFRWNTVFISKNIVESKKGDLLFFEN
ncbi:MAG TPA: DUF1175 family protein, partial [Leptospiraceae bacterium]|nr:DUF1175 family protein [Leptospiraceae bacterium]